MRVSPAHGRRNLAARIGAGGALAVPAAAVAVVVALAAFVTTIGADSRWLAALGRSVVALGAIPHGLPFAPAASSHWPNVPVLAELVFHGLANEMGDRGLMMAQLLAVALAFAFLAWSSRAAGAEVASVGLVIPLVGIAALPYLAVVRAELFSLALFPLLLALLRAESRRPSRRIWLVLPLLALWSNLHGAALVGLAVMLVYLFVERLRWQPYTASAIAVLSVAALCLTPALLRTPAYYWGVLTNVAAQRGVGLWTPLSLRSGFGLLLVAVLLVLVALAWPRRPSMWEVVVAFALAGLTVHSSRSGVWLLFLLVTPACLGRPIRLAQTGFLDTVVLVTVTLSAVAFTGLFVHRGPVAAGAGSRLIAHALALAGREPILAQDSLAEQVALAGGRIWVGNPIDAFSRRDQALYLDWLEGAPRGRLVLDAESAVVLVRKGTAAQQLLVADGGFVLVDQDAKAALYTRRARLGGRTGTS
jgi:hypothetical protein